MPMRTSRTELRRSQLAEAAYALLSEGGMEAVTAEAVAHRAGLSRRTLFNYFSSAEDALTASLTEWVAELTRAVLTRPDGEDLADSLRAAMARQPSPDVLEQLRTLVLAARCSPGARRFAAEFGIDQGEALEVMIRERVGEDVDDVLVGYTARGLVAAAETATNIWVDRVTGSVTPEDASLHHDLVTAAVELLLHGIEGRTGR
jgi:AcrR family transcriptional regulator